MEGSDKGRKEREEEGGGESERTCLVIASMSCAYVLNFVGCTVILTPS